MIASRILAVWGRLAGRPQFGRINRFLVNLGACGLGVGNANFHSNGELGYLRRWFGNSSSGRSSPVVVDVGANEGAFAEVLLACCPRATIHAFEPHPRTFVRLTERMAGRPVHCHNLALGARVGRAELWDYGDAPDGTSHATFHPHTVSQMTQAELTPRDVTVDTLDNQAKEAGISEIALLKLDVEGHELACLEGASDLLGRRAVELVQFEFNAMHLDARVHMGDFARILPGFDLFRIQPGGLLPLSLRDPMLANLYRMQNILAVRQPYRLVGDYVYPV